IWQANIGKTIVAHVPVSGGEVLETGDFELDGVTFPAAEIVLEFEDPADGEGAMFPTGNLVDTLDGPDGPIEATLINAGIPAVFVNATDLGYTGAELREALNSDPAALERFEALRTAGATGMGIAKTGRAPDIAFVAPPADHVTSSG
ncbi:putative methylaconitate Delta-isomerase PrpF, partial [Escherichia coli]|nr:putative methylaconitate Delta-isomerase PrpF [Escherichia coli]